MRTRSLLFAYLSTFRSSRTRKPNRPIVKLQLRSPPADNQLKEREGAAVGAEPTPSLPMARTTSSPFLPIYTLARPGRLIRPHLSLSTLHPLWVALQLLLSNTMPAPGQRPKLLRGKAAVTAEALLGVYRFSGYGTVLNRFPLGLLRRRGSFPLNLHPPRSRPHPSQMICNILVQFHFTPKM